MSEPNVFEIVGLDRRDFLKGATVAGLSLLAGAEEIFAADAPATPEPTGPPVGCGVIGLGPWGREILDKLSRQPLVQITAICDTYEPFVTRSKEIAPKADTFTDYHKLLEKPEVQAVFVATPSHQHKQIVLDALQAGKHVYCEAPLAITIDEAKAIAQAGKDAKTLFASGLQYRSNPQHHHALSFMRAGILAHVSGAYGQYHKKESWRRPAPSPDRAKEINWRLYKETSPGLMGEIGIHQVDVGSWYLNALPISVYGSSGTMNSTDDRTIPDTVQCLFEYPASVTLSYHATLASSYGGTYEVFMGSDSTMVLQDLRAWMVKETDSPLLGWEVYAKKEQFTPSTGDTGIVLVANATKILAAGKDPASAALDVSKTPLYYAIEDFATAIQTNKKPSAGPEEGYRATVVALKSHEAAMTGQKIVFQKEWFDL